MCLSLDTRTVLGKGQTGGAVSPISRLTRNRNYTRVPKRSHPELKGVMSEPQNEREQACTFLQDQQPWGGIGLAFQAPGRIQNVDPPNPGF